jgi:ATPase subunit of ABC transporter with duplicated ATPase domains
MSDTVEQPKKQPHRGNEWMKMMREKAAAKKAENKKIKDAQKAKAEDERKKKLQEAEEILNPKQKEIPQPVESVEDNKPIDVAHLNASKTPQTPIKKTKKKVVIVNSDGEEELDYKQAYYKA